MIITRMTKLVKGLVESFVVLFKNNIVVKRAVITAMSFVLILSVFVTVFSVTDLTYALQVNLNGENCGYVTDQTVVDKAVSSLNEISVNDDKNYSDPNVDCSYTVVSASQLISSQELADNIVDNDDNVNKAICVIVNGNLFAEAESLDSALSILSAIAGANPFYNDVEVRECLLSDNAKSRLKSLDKRLDDLIFTDIEYLTEKGDTKASIAQKFGLNENDIDDFNCGDVITVKALMPAFVVTHEEQFETKKSIPASASGTKSGWDVTTKVNVFVGGVKVNTKAVGTRFEEKFPNKPTATAVVKAGKKGFCWPVDTGYRQYISSFWGDDRDHKGYDIAASKGTPVLSVYGGKVVSVNSSGDAYGLHFVIDHGNGIKTLYAHCSKLYVSIGDRVERGEVVGLIGDTGRATGTHLHFEVYKNGARVDPMNYIGKR